MESQKIKICSKNTSSYRFLEQDIVQSPMCRALCSFCETTQILSWVIYTFSAEIQHTRNATGLIMSTTHARPGNPPVQRDGTPKVQAHSQLPKSSYVQRETTQPDLSEMVSLCPNTWKQGNGPEGRAIPQPAAADSSESCGDRTAPMKALIEERHLNRGHERIQ